MSTLKAALAGFLRRNHEIGRSATPEAACIGYLTRGASLALPPNHGRRRSSFGAVTCRSIQEVQTVVRTWVSCFPPDVSPPPPGLGINMMKLGINTSRLVTVPLRRGACIINLVGHDDSLPSWHPSLCPPEP